MVNRVARGAEITLATYNINVLKVLKSRDIDVVFLNITSSRSELQFARALSTISHAQAMIFISDHSRYAVDAFELNALDYLVKPVTFRRISESMHRLPASHTSTAGDQTLAVTHGSITQFIWRSDIVWAEAHGDHVFLHTHHERHTLRTPLASLADAWYAAGFMRIHRSYLVNIGKIEQIQTRSSRITVLMDDGAELNVSRRQARELPEYMVQSDLV